VTAQNTFNGMNSLNVEFGFGNSVQVDSVIIKYPSGQTDVSTNVSINQFYYAKEGASLSPVGIFENPNLESAWIEIYPNPASNFCKIKVTPSNTGQCKISLCDLTGRGIKTIYEGMISNQSCEFNINADTLPSGIYFCRFDFKSIHMNRELVIVK